MKTEMEKRYVRPYVYNAVKMLNAMCDEIYKRGGHIVSDWRDELSFVEVHCRKESLKLAQETNINKAIPVVTPLWGCSTCYIHFELNGYIYYVEIPDNVFENIYYSKVACDNNFRITTRCYMDKVENTNDIMNMLYNQDPVIRDNDVLVENSTKMLDWLVGAKSNPYTEHKRTRVANTYNSGYHYENIPIKFSKVYKRFDITTGKII